MDLTLLRLDSPTEVREFEKGRFETYRVGPMTYVSIHFMGSEDYAT